MPFPSSGPGGVNVSLFDRVFTREEPVDSVASLPSMRGDGCHLGREFNGTLEMRGDRSTGRGPVGGASFSAFSYAASSAFGNDEVVFDAPNECDRHNTYDAVQLRDVHQGAEQSVSAVLQNKLPVPQPLANSRVRGVPVDDSHELDPPNGVAPALAPLQGPATDGYISEEADYSVCSDSSSGSGSDGALSSRSGVVLQKGISATLVGIAPGGALEGIEERHDTAVSRYSVAPSVPRVNDVSSAMATAVAAVGVSAPGRVLGPPPWSSAASSAPGSPVVLPWPPVRPPLSNQRSSHKFSHQ